MHLTANDVSLYLEKTGDGPPLLLLHGNGEDHHIFDTLCAKLRAHFTIYAPDSRNHGQSEKTEDYSYETMAEDVYALIKTLALKAVPIVGFSDGAIIALLLAMEHPEVLSRLALLGANLSPQDFKLRAYRDMKQVYRETGDPLLHLMLTQPQIKPEQLRKIMIPCLVTAGEHDIFQQKTPHTIAQNLPNAQTMIFSEHSHDSYVTGSDMLYPHLLNFFAGKPVFPHIAE